MVEHTYQPVEVYGEDTTATMPDGSPRILRIKETNQALHVSPVDGGGNPTAFASDYINGEPKPYESSVALSGTANTHTVYADLGRYGVVGYIQNDHTTQNIRLFVSKDGTSYNNYVSYAAAVAANGYITVKPGEGYDLSKHKVHTLKVDASGNNTSYRIAIL